ncbi:hypothetical protein BaRGS_00002185, partial [Batillaria attramentaria]
IPSVETLLTALQDEYAFLRGKWRSVIFRISVCSLGFLLGLPQTTQGGTYLLDLLDIFVGFPLLLVGLFEFIAIVWVYGFHRLSEDIMLMMGDSAITRILYYGYFSWTWLIVAPGLILAIIVFDSIGYEPITGPGYPEWSETLGWLVVAFIMMWIPKLIELNQPTPEWGPHLPEHRTIPRYQQLRPDYDNQPSYPYAQPGAVIQMQPSANNGPPAYNGGKQYDNPGFDSSNEKLNTRM